MTKALNLKQLHLVALIAAILFSTNANPQQTDVPDWQKIAGGKMSFEVASVRPAAPGTYIQPTVRVGPEDSSEPTGGLFRDSYSLFFYIQFAYKLLITERQEEAVLKSFPEWVKTDKYVIEARAPADTTKDQMRLMMQSLLAERFGLKLHFEQRETPVMIMTSAQPGETGPKLYPHSQGPPCDRAAPIPATGEVPTIWPLLCNTDGLRFDGQHPAIEGSRNVTLDLIAMNLSFWAERELGRTLINKTGLSGQYDFALTWAYNPNGSLPIDSPALQGPAFLEAMRDELGIKLTPAKLPVPTLVIDHLERPSVN